MNRLFNLPKHTTCELQIKTMIFGPKAHFDRVIVTSDHSEVISRGIITPHHSACNLTDLLKTDSKISNLPKETTCINRP